MDRGNPFAPYGIKSVAIPMFVNQSSVAQVAAPMTEQIVTVLSRYPNLVVLNGDSKKADAVLLGIVRSADRHSEVFKTKATTFTEGEIASSIGRRSKFVLPVETEYRLSLQIVLVKRSGSSLDSSKEKLLRSSIGESLRGGSGIIFNETIHLTGSFKREVRATISPDSAGMVNFTKTKRHFKTSVVKLAQGAAETFKERVLNAF